MRWGLVGAGVGKRVLEVVVEGRGRDRRREKMGGRSAAPEERGVRKGSSKTVFLKTSLKLSRLGTIGLGDVIVTRGVW